MEKIIFAISILALLLLAACGPPSSTDTTTTGTSDVGSVPSDEDSGLFSGTLADAMKLGKSYKCTYTDQQGNKAEMYVKGKKFRTESTSQGVKSAAIMDENQCMWIWQEGTTQGTKFCVPEGTEEKTTTSSGATSGQVSTDVKVECNSMIINDDKFTPPSNVQFTDLMAALEQATQGLGNTPTAPSDGY